LFRYFDDRNVVFSGSKASLFISRTARVRRRVAVQRDRLERASGLLIDFAKKALAAATSRLALNLESIVFPARSTARYR
jgi:hypothetical protein